MEAEMVDPPFSVEELLEIVGKSVGKTAVFVLREYVSVRLPYTARGETVLVVAFVVAASDGGSACELVVLMVGAA